MQDRDFLITILKAIDHIGRHREEEVSQFCYHRAVAFECIMMGEAASQVSVPIKQTYSTIAWKSMINTRHRLAHKPWDVKPSILDDIVINHLPPLKEQITALLRQLDG